MEPTEWQIENSHAIASKFKKFASKHPDEFASVFANLEKIMRLLRGGNKVGGFRTNFFRSEGEGVYRIGQSGVAHAKESRLYIYPDEQARTVYVLTVGDKDSQETDINEAKEIVRGIKKPTAQPKDEDKI